jgi:hypothetical protein
VRQFFPSDIDSHDWDQDARVLVSVPGGCEAEALDRVRIMNVVAVDDSLPNSSPAGTRLLTPDATTSASLCASMSRSWDFGTFVEDRKLQATLAVQRETVLSV